MQRRLRLRFLFISWVLLTMFLVAICIGVSMILYRSSVNSTENSLKESLKIMSFDDPTRGMAGFTLEEHGFLRGYQLSHINLSTETLTNMVKQMNKNAKRNTGQVYYDGVMYRYLVIRQGTVSYGVLAECSQEQALVATLKRNSLIFCIAGFFLLFPVCLLLTKWVSRPIETAWEKQNDFVSDATHELKTPLTVIATNTEAVLSNPNATIESQERWLDSIQGETSRMAGLVGNLLFLAKVDAAEIHPAPEDLEITDLLEEMCMERESEFYEAGRMFEYEMTPGLHYYGDWKLIQRMMGELLANARMYTPEGGTIRMVVNRTRKLHLRIVLSNTGAQISQQDLPKLFDRFYRADPSRARNTGGYGLGLSVAKSIAELHEGTITAESQNGINVFTVVLGDLHPEEGKNDKK